MAKNNKIKKHQDIIEDNFDFSEMLSPSYDGETMSEVINELIEASNNQMVLALELTKLALTKNTSQDMKEDDVFTIFKKASAVIVESFPLKSLLETLPDND